MGPLSIRHGTAQHVITRIQNETRWVARVLAGTFCRTWREDLCHFTHQWVSCPLSFRAMENPPTSAAWLRPWLSTAGSVSTWSAAVSTGPVSLTTICAILTIDDLEGREACRSCSWLLTRARQRQAVDVFPQGGGGGGISRCGRLCPWENGRNACVKHCFIVHLRRVSTHSSICFYFAGAFLHSGQPGFQLRLVRSSFFVWQVSFGSSWLFFFHLCLLSLSVLSSKERLHASLVLLGNPCKKYQHQSIGKRWNESPSSLPSERLAHPNTQQVLTFWKFWQNIGLQSEGAEASEGNHESPALATQCETPCATSFSNHGVCTILRAIGTIYVIR